MKLLELIALRYKKNGVNCSENCKDKDCYLVQAIETILDLYNKEKNYNRKLDRENQALYESINCDDNTMLARLYQEEKEKSKLIEELKIELNNARKEKEELKKDNAELRRLRNGLSIATAIALGGRKIPISKKTLNELNDMFSIEIEHRPFYDDYVFYAK